MAGVIDSLTEIGNSLYEEALLVFSPDGSIVLQVLLLAIGLAILSLFIWEFYKSTSKRNLIQLNLSKYNFTEHPIASKILAMILYLVEYIIIMPLLIILWYGALSFVLLVIAGSRSVEEVLMIAAIFIGAIRILAYYKGEISKDLAKLFPFIALSLFILSPGNVDFGSVTQRINEVPLLLNNILYFIFVVLAIEIVLRVFYTLYDFWKSEEEAIGEKKLVPVKKEAVPVDKVSKKKKD